MPLGHSKVMTTTFFEERFELLEDYELAGGNGNAGIALMKDRTTGEKIILKKLLPRATAEEATSMQRMIGHDNIVQLRHISHDSESQKEKRLDLLDTNVLYMEYCDLGSLSELMERHKAARKKVPEPFMWHVLLSSTKALKHCHEGIYEDGKWVPIAHGDVCPSNILFSSSGATNQFPRVVLADFGNSSEFSNEHDLSDEIVSQAMEDAFRLDFSGFVNSIGPLCMCETGKDIYVPLFSLKDLVGEGEFAYSEELKVVLEAGMKLVYGPKSEDASRSGFMSSIEEISAHFLTLELDGELLLPQ